MIATGTPEHIATVEASHTGRYLRAALAASEQPQPALELV